MSRLNRAIHNLASGYVVMVVTIITALLSLRIANQYLNREEFGLWALMGSISIYLSLIDVGMSGSVARLLIDYKDDQTSGDYSSLIRTGSAVLAVQGAIIFCAGFFLAPFLCDWLKIEDALCQKFTMLLRWQSALLAFGFAVRIFGHLLYAHQRFDITSYGQIATAIVNLGLLWFFFSRGHGVFSLVWANIATAIGNTFLLSFACRMLHLFPEKTGAISWIKFKELFGYGKDMFLVSVGLQLIMFSQTFIITRNLGLAAGALWNIGTKMFNMVSQAIWKASDFSLPAFSEMMARNEQTILRERYRDMVIMTGSLSGFAAISYVLCNSLFVTLWMRGKFFWPVQNDVLLGVLLMVAALLRCQNGLILMTKKVGFMKYVYFIEGLVFVLSAIFVARFGGMLGIIACSIICSVVFSGAYGTWRVTKYLTLSIKEVSWEWLRPMMKVVALFLPPAIAVWWLEKSLSAQVRFALNILFCCSYGIFLFLRFGIPKSFRSELLERAPKSFVPLLRRVFGLNQNQKGSRII